MIILFKDLRRYKLSKVCQTKKALKTRTFYFIYPKFLQVEGNSDTSVIPRFKENTNIIVEEISNS